MVLWLYDENKNIWYRLFNDGAYCGVDQYAEDESGQDLDDDIRVVDYSGWFRGKPVLSAPVFIETNEPCDLNVLLNFGASACKMVYHRAGQICSIRLVDACF